MKRIALIIAAMALVSCYKQSESEVRAGNGIKVEKLFTHEGCTMYRFQDANMVYWSDCRGSTQYTTDDGKGHVSIHREITN